MGSSITSERHSIVQGYDIWFRERFGLIEEYRPPLGCIPCWQKDKCHRGDFACTFHLEEEKIVQKVLEILK